MKWEYIGTGLGLIGVGFALMLALPPPGWPRMPSNLVHFGILTGLVLAVVGAALTFVGMLPSLHQRPGPPLFIIVGLLFCVSGVGWYALTSHRFTGPKQASPEPVPTSAPPVTEGPAPPGENSHASAPTPKQAGPSAQEIAAAVAEKTRIREAFGRELDRPVRSMYAIITLSEPRTPEELSQTAAVLNVLPEGTETRDGLYFGYRSGSSQWTQIPGNIKQVIKGVRSQVWICSTQIDEQTKPTVLDNFLVYRFDHLTRLEAGAGGLHTPFAKVGDLDHATVSFEATPDAIAHFAKVALVVNDYVIFELGKDEIAGWRLPPPPMVGVIQHGHMDENGRMVVERREEKPISFDRNLTPEFRGLPLHMALPKDSVRLSAIMPMWTSINLAEFNVRFHRINAIGLPHAAGDGEMMLPPGETGWLAEEKHHSS